MKGGAQCQGEALKLPGGRAPSIHAICLGPRGDHQGAASGGWALRGEGASSVMAAVP